jgi:NO-binding membrane sensor protein with MHYT domain
LEVGSYRVSPVIVSVIAAVLSSFAALTTVPGIASSSEKNGACCGRVHSARVWARVSGRYIAMLAFQLPVPVHYDIALTLLP